jgi:hypothetical protein
VVARRRVAPSAGGTRERAIVSRPHRADRERTGRRPRVSRDRHPAASTSRKRGGGRGTGAVMATGSYEGSLSTEGIPDPRKRRLSRAGVAMRSWPCPRPPTRPNLRQGERAAKLQHPRRWVRRRTNGHRDRGVRGSVVSAPWAQYAHDHLPAREVRGLTNRVDGDPPK